MEMKRNELKAENLGLKIFFKKEVVVRFIDENNQIVTTTGILTEFYEGDEDIEGYIVVQSDTDYDKIPSENIRKIYLKK